MGNSVAAQPRPHYGRKLEIVLFVFVVVIATALIVGTIRVRRAHEERAAVRRAWKLGTVVLFEGDESYTNPPFTPAEWDAELRRGPLDDLVNASPTAILFVRPAPAMRWPEPIVDDDDIPELIAILRQLPTVRSVQLDENITPAGRTRLKTALPAVIFTMPRRQTAI